MPKSSITSALKVFVLLATTSLSVAAQEATYEISSVKQLRLEAVALSKQGQQEQSISALLDLHRQHPNNPWITSDLIVLLRVAGRNQEIALLTQNTEPDTIHQYAWIDWAAALRDERQYARAQNVLSGGRAQKLGVVGLILYATLAVEASDTTTALRSLPSEQIITLSSNNLAGMAYVQRRAGHPIAALRLTERALRLDHNNRAAIREQVFALLALRATNKALSELDLHKGYFTTAEREQIIADKTTAEIRNALNERRRLDRIPRYSERNLALDSALKQLQTNLREFSTPHLLLITRYDEIYVLSELQRMHDAIQQYEALPQDPASAPIEVLRNIPPYVRIAAANAYFSIRQPAKAVPIYEDVIAQHPDIGVSNFISLYYTYIDNEQYEKGEALLEKIYQQTPVWTRTVERKPNWERVDVDQLWAMEPVYHNDNALAELRAKELMNRAPMNTGIINTVATVERWRGWPEKSLKTTGLAAAYEPEARETRLNLAANYRDIGENERWAEEIGSLYNLFPQDEAVRRKQAEWLDRNTPSFSTEYITGNSDSKKTNAPPVAGNTDQEWLTRLNSPWIGNWRSFLQHHWIGASYDEDPTNYNRVGIGAEWKHRRAHFWTILENDEFTGNNVGISAGWSQWLDDYWQYNISGNTYSTQTPLQAKRAGYSGESINTKLMWRQSESREAYAGLSLLSISDGNDRLSFSAGLSQRIFANPYHITNLSVDVLAENNSKPGGNYYNPANIENLSISLQHKWITWRDFDRSLTQYFKITPGYSWQDNYGGDPNINLLYEHEWQLSRTWKLHYGIGWGSNVYDGDRGNRVYGLIGFGGVF